MQPAGNVTLRALLECSNQLERRACFAANGSVRFSDVLTGSCFSDQSRSFDDRSVFLATPDQLTTAIAMIKLDGHARRVILCPPDVEPRQFAAIVADGQVDTIVCGEDTSDFEQLGLPVVPAGPQLEPQPSPAEERYTEWVLLTSGTGGIPKLVLHDLASLIGAI
ncbi:MAG: long-chain fatty acid--CoA ligase, partial [Gammaproteobacteria bacterium]